MDPILAVWRRLGLAQRFVAVIIPIALVAACGGAAFAVVALTPTLGPVAEVEPDETTSPIILPPPLPPVETLAPAVSPTPSSVPPPPEPDPLLGTDGRLTVLLLGSDYRPARPGNRTDAIMVVSVDPTTGKSAGFSIPRDTAGFPLGNGKKFGAKVNGLYAHLESQTGDGGPAMRKAVAKAFDIEVDGYVFIGFQGVKELVKAVGGVDVTLDEAYYDAHYWVSARRQGWGLPKGKSHLGPNDALIFARSRKGDNDFGRARRQQILVLAALDKARSRGVAALPKLLQIAARTVRTDLPLDRATDLFQIVRTTNIATVNRTVFGPTKFAAGKKGGSFALRINECRDWIAANFPPMRPMGRWPVDGVAIADAPAGRAAASARP
jgi:polyisoprenyl-teichoic acid--peptidoglycan teichoic acid transferase